MRRHLLIGLPLLACLVLPSYGAERMCLSGDGQNRVCIVIDSSRYPLREDRRNVWSILERSIGNIASNVADYIEKSAGGRPEIVDVARNGTPVPGMLRLHIGRSAYVEATVGETLESLKPCGYLIRTAGPDDILISGRDSRGTEFGSYEFLERFLGVRWLFPGPDGAYVPRHTELEIPASVDIVEGPAFRQVPALAFKNEDHRVWARRHLPQLQRAGRARQEVPVGAESKAGRRCA